MRKMTRLRTNRKADYDENHSKISPSVASPRSNEDGKIDTNDAKTGTQHRKHDLFDWISLTVLIFTFLAAFCAAKEAGRLADTAEHTERVQLRAFVYFDKPIFQVLNKPEADARGVYNLPGTLGKIVLVSLVLVNGGDTATESLQIVTSCPYVDVDVGKLPNDPFSLFRWDDKKAIPYPVGPKQPIPIDCTELSVDEAYSGP